MARQIIKQPDGKYAIWSSIVDDFIVKDCTPKELINFRLTENEREVIEDIMKVVKELNEGKKPYSHFTMTWEEANELRKEIHGIDK